MDDIEADDEISSVDDRELLFLMDGIALSSSSKKCNASENVKYETVRRRKINNAERNLLLKTQMCINQSEFTFNESSHLRPFERWKNAIHKINKLKDPWKNFDTNGIAVERVERYQFDPSNDKWLEPVECFVKLEGHSFNHGSMRECFRLKKMSSLFKQECDWNHAVNYVAKRYLENVDSSIYYEDVKLQIDAKLWGQEYSRQQGVTKKVDICKMSLIKFIDRPDQPLYHLEHFIEGDYIKYNSNSGFVDENTRNTPQAFSHFTFERSGHKLIVVDIQGVGDLYTDPQIHTFSRLGYGDGNLGPRGMALFFYSHTCNSICQMLGLEEFDLCPTEKAVQHLGSPIGINAGTVAQLGEKVISVYADQNPSPGNTVLIKRIGQASLDESGPDGDSTGLSSSCPGDDGDDEDNGPDRSVHSSEMDGLFFISSMERKPSKANVANPLERASEVGQSILGEIHHEMARLHNCGKFIDPTISTDVNWEAFMFHEELAARLGCLEATRNLACFYLDLMSESLFENCPLTAGSAPGDRERGLHYMEEAARSGDRRSMLWLAEQLLAEGGDLHRAYGWFEAAVGSAAAPDDSGCFDCTSESPLHEILARMASLQARGGPSMPRDLDAASDLYRQAAEVATRAGKGRLATKYYELAESVAM